MRSPWMLTTLLALAACDDGGGPTPPDGQSDRPGEAAASADPDLSAGDQALKGDDPEEMGASEDKQDDCPEAHSLAVDWLNTPQVGSVDLEAAGIDPTSSGHIIGWRNGPDGYAGTWDDHRFSALDELADAWFGGPATPALIEAAIRVDCAAPPLIAKPVFGDEDQALPEQADVVETDPITIELPEPPRLTEVHFVGTDLLEARFDQSVGEPRDEQTWRAVLGLSVQLDPEAEAEAWPLLDVWRPPTGERDVIWLALAEPLPEGAVASLTVLNPFSVAFDPELGEAAAVSPEQPESVLTWATDWADGGVGWAFFPEVPAEAMDPGWHPGPGGLVARGGVLAEAPMEAVAPAHHSGRDMKVSATFRILDDDLPFNRHAFPRVMVRAVNAESWMGCYLRNDQTLATPPEDAFPNALSPALNCTQQQPERARVYFEGCRLQFHEDGPNIRYDWPTHHTDRHRLDVVVVGDHMRASLYNLDHPPMADPEQPVAVVDVPDVTLADGGAPTVGMPGVAVFDSGEVLFESLEAAPAEAADLPPLDAQWALPEGRDCPGVGQ